jgi:DNA-binding IclR family transcriptional regulator
MDERIAGSQAVDRALSILELFDEATPELGIAEVAGRLGVHRSTAGRLLAALDRHGLLERDASGQRYRLGLGLVSLAGHVLNRFPVRSLAHDTLRQLRDATGETAYLGLLDGDEVTYLDQASSPHVTVNADWVGYRQPLTAGATGRALLAFRPRAVIEETLAAARAHGASEADLPSELELAAVRRQGYLLRVASGEPPQTGVAAPVRDHRGEVIAAITVGGPSDRITPERLESEVLPGVLRAAAWVSESLGYRVA